MKKTIHENELVVMFNHTAKLSVGNDLTLKSDHLEKKDVNDIEKLFSKKKAVTNRVFSDKALKSLQKETHEMFKKLEIDPATMISIKGRRDLIAMQQKFLKNKHVLGAFIKPPAEDPSVQDWETGDLSTSQGYLDPAPNGIDAKFAWQFGGGRGENVEICDVEQGINMSHEDFPSNFGGFLGGKNTDSSKNHGTAVIGVLAAKDNGEGVTGISHNSEIKFISHRGLGTSQAIIEAADSLNSGDIILLEVHRRGPASNGVPDSQDGFIAIEWWPDDFAAISYATSKGIIVVEAAGNGAEDLDAEIYNNRQSGFPLSWRNPFNLNNPQCGAVMVGAGSPSSSIDRTILSFSNWGSRVDVQGWGRSVATLGYGGLQSDKTVTIDPFNGWTPDASDPKNTSSVFSGVGLRNIDAALWSGTNDKIYIFSGENYSRVDPNTMVEDTGYPKEIKDSWNGLPSKFESYIDAALWNAKSEKIYFFKGDEFIRIDPNNGWDVESGYPKKIAGNWPGLPANFTEKIDAACWNDKNNKVYLFSDSNYVRIDPNNSWKVDAGYPKPIQGNWEDLPESFNNSIDYAVYNPKNKKLYVSKSEDIIYTGGFSGTSSASPIVTGAIACIQSRLKARGKSKLNSFTAQDLMRSTGTPQLRFSGEVETNDKSNWRGVNATFGSGIDAALWNGKSDKVYMFKGSQFVRIDPKNDWNVEATYPKPLKDNWGGLPTNFESGIDAALWSDTNKKVYLFKGSEYVRIDPFNDWDVEPGYPKPISGNWPGFPSNFTNGVDSAVWNSKNNRIYFFKDDEYIRVNPSNSWNVDTGYPKSISGNWSALTNNGFDADLDAMLWSGTNKKVYAFKGEDYVRLDPFDSWNTNSGYPAIIARQRIGNRPDLKEVFAHLDIDSNWPGFPSSFGQDLDAALHSQKNNKAYFFKGSQYVRVSPNNNWEMDSGYPKNIAGNWDGLPASFQSGIDAALWNSKSTKVYFFKGAEYVRIDPNNSWKVEPGYPKPIAGNWPGFPSNFANGVDAAIWTEKNDKIYFFKGDDYIRVDPNNGWNVESGYPKPIAGNWDGLDTNFNSGIDVALWNNKSDKVYFFKGDQYVRIDPNNGWDVDKYYPRPIISD
ncbi:MAG: hemopexin repeat-containing protein [Crocinitomicaceae bacterium]|nr:hemopexin repeat-containing protein [Crocinitomicaceae bacterium]